MGMLIRASCVIGVIALYSPVHEAPVDTRGAVAAVSSLRQQVGAIDAERAVKGIHAASQAVEALKSMPPDVRSRVLDAAGSLVMAPVSPPSPARRAPQS